MWSYTIFMNKFIIISFNFLKMFLSLSGYVHLSEYKIFLIIPDSHLYDVIFSRVFSHSFNSFYSQYPCSRLKVWKTCFSVLFHLLTPILTTQLTINLKLESQHKSHYMYYRKLGTNLLHSNWNLLNLSLSKASHHQNSTPFFSSSPSRTSVILFQL